MSIVEFHRMLSWSLDESETVESTKYPWVGLVEGVVSEKKIAPPPPCY